MATAVQVSNVALARVGVAPDYFIDSLESPTNEGKAVKALFEHCRDTLLNSFPWKFAERRSTLALLEDVEREGWEYAYQLPADYLSSRNITNAVRSPAPDARIPYGIESNDAGSGMILTSDHEEIELVYTAKIAPESFPPLIADALAWLLASELAMVLPNKADYRQYAYLRYDQAVTRATAVDLAMGHEAEPESQLIKARY